MNLFYAPDISGELYTLNEEESRHCIKVLRLSSGDSIVLTDGRGQIFETTIINDKGKNCIVQINRSFSAIPDPKSPNQHRPTAQSTNQPIDQSTNPFAWGFRPYRLHLAIAPTKNIDRFEWFLEKSTEIGIDEITPLICAHSERRQLRTDRLEKVITSAMKQSLKAFHPVLREPVSFSHFIRNEPVPGRDMAYINEGVPLLQRVYETGQDAVILIGPEGDFSPEEVESAIQAGYKVVSLGNSRLRTETAGVVACSVIYGANSG